MVGEGGAIAMAAPSNSKYASLRQVAHARDPGEDQVMAQVAHIFVGVAIQRRQSEFKSVLADLQLEFDRLAAPDDCVCRDTIRRFRVMLQRPFSVDVYATVVPKNESSQWD
jgi:hypothetical protein